MFFYVEKHFYLKKAFPGLKTLHWVILLSKDLSPHGFYLTAMCLLLVYFYTYRQHCHVFVTHSYPRPSHSQTLAVTNLTASFRIQIIKQCVCVCVWGGLTWHENMSRAHGALKRKSVKRCWTKSFINEAKKTKAHLGVFCEVGYVRRTQKASGKVCTKVPSNFEDPLALVSFFDQKAASNETPLRDDNAKWKSFPRNKCGPLVPTRS